MTDSELTDIKLKIDATDSLISYLMHKNLENHVIRASLELEIAAQALNADAKNEDLAEDVCDAMANLKDAQDKASGKYISHLCNYDANNKTVPDIPKQKMEEIIAEVVDQMYDKK